MSIPELIQVSQAEASQWSQQKEATFGSACSSRVPQTESAVQCPFSKRDHLSLPEMGPATVGLPAMAGQIRTCRVDVAQQASRIKQHLFPSAHNPPSVTSHSILLLSQLPPHQRLWIKLSQGNGREKW
ncbi:hypothetical protein AMECASPLE_009368 [Ameca splendens]|uniref:Uncharacterized protein n=1 Tax=Ameca splendens TaxID=208324 RepID=A0ABV0ZXD2_9TELE